MHVSLLEFELEQRGHASYAVYFSANDQPRIRQLGLDHATPLYIRIDISAPAFHMTLRRMCLVALW